MSFKQKSEFLTEALRGNNFILADTKIKKKKFMDLITSHQKSLF